MMLDPGLAGLVSEFGVKSSLSTAQMASCRKFLLRSPRVRCGDVVEGDLNAGGQRSEKTGGVDYTRSERGRPNPPAGQVDQFTWADNRQLRSVNSSSARLHRQSECGYVGVSRELQLHQIRTEFAQEALACNPESTDKWSHGGAFQEMVPRTHGEPEGSTPTEVPVPLQACTFR
jgi:hypothetical protein